MNPGISGRALGKIYSTPVFTSVSLLDAIDIQRCRFGNRSEEGTIVQMILIVPVRILFRLFTPHIVTVTTISSSLKREENWVELIWRRVAYAHLYIGVISLLYQTTNIAESFCRGGRMSHGNSAVPWRTALAVTIGPATTNITVDPFNNLKILSSRQERATRDRNGNTM